MIEPGTRFYDSRLFYLERFSLMYSIAMITTGEFFRFVFLPDSSGFQNQSLCFFLAFAGKVYNLPIQNGNIPLV